MKYYSLKEAEKIIRKLKRAGEQIEGAYLGMSGDWSMTSEPVYENGEFIVKGGVHGTIRLAGITGSMWATPTLRVQFKDGKFSEFPCFIDEDELYE
jgi:hypothetical protein